VHLDAAGRDVRAEFRDRPAAEAVRLTEELPVLCRAARQQAQLAGGSRPPAGHQ
jgi:hypothetical protein